VPANGSTGPVVTRKTSARDAKRRYDQDVCAFEIAWGCSDGFYWRLWLSVKPASKAVLRNRRARNLAVHNQLLRNRQTRSQETQARLNHLLWMLRPPPQGKRANPLRRPK
jgi:hypothetical protein